MESSPATSVRKAPAIQASDGEPLAKVLYIIPFLLFIVSGAWGLVYEVTWARYLSLFIGNTTLSHMCVLAAYMGGLALGSLIIGAKTVQVKKPLAGYGYLEIAIGAYAILYPFLVKKLEALTLSMLSGVEFGSPVLTAGKLTVSMLALLLPTFLMGGTFPMLMKHFKPAAEQADDKAEWLYLANCAGAVGGTLLAGFLLIPTMGLSATLMSVGAANIAIGIVGVILGLSGEVALHHAVPQETFKRETEAPSTPAVPIYAAIGISGATAMVYELVWIRIFAMTLGSSTYSFSLMLAAFISGLSLGSLAVGLIGRLRSSPVFWFGISELGIALTVVVSIPFYQKLPWVFWKWASILQRSAETIGLYNLIKYSLCFAVMLVPTVFFGMTLPLAIKAVARRDEGIGRDSGFVYGANTVGTLIGALLTGLVLIPFTGLRTSLHIALLANVLAAVLVLMYSPVRMKRIIALVGAAAVVGILVTNPPWSQRALIKGTFRLRGEAPPTWDAYLATLSEEKILYTDEDGGQTVAVTSSLTGREMVRDKLLVINGKTDGSAWSDMVTQKLVAQIPLLFHPGSRKDVLIVGLGTGASAGAALTHPDVWVDCVEISPAVARAVRYFDDVNYSVRKNPRFNLVIEDARTLVAMTKKKYDVIVSEPTNPWIAGVGNLFTLEYFQSLDRILKPDGVASIWLQAYELSDDLLQMVGRTVRSVFPYVYVFEAGTNDYILLVSRKPINPDFGAMERKMRIRSVYDDLDRICIDSLPALLSRQVLSPTTFDQCVGTGALNTDDLPLLEYRAPAAHYVRALALLFEQMDERRQKKNDLFMTDYLKYRPLDRSAFRSIIRISSDSRTSRLEVLLPLLEHYLSKWPDDPELLKRYAQLVMDNQPEKAMKAVKRATEIKPSADGFEIQADILFRELLLRHSMFAPQDFRPVLELMDKALKLDPDNSELRTKRQQILSFITD